MRRQTLYALAGVALAMVATALFLLAGFLDMGKNPQTTIVPLGDFGQKIQDLYVLIFWLSVVVFVTVEGALVFAVLRYRHRPGDALPPQLHGNTRLEIAWTIAPAVVLFIIAVPTISTVFETSAPPKGAGVPLEVLVTGHQWWWEFEYPEGRLVTANEAHIPVGRPVTFRLRSVDVIHSFWVPRLGGKIDVVPNHENTMHLTADQPGMYPGQCVEFCGIQHANMRLRVVAHPPEGFQAWLVSQQQPPPVPTGKAEEGAQLFMRSACVGCHTIAGTPAQGKVGPNLTHFGSRTSVAAGVLENTPANLARWLRNPQEVKPGNQMPNLKLSDQDVEKLVAYLGSLQ